MQFFYKKTCGISTSDIQSCLQKLFPYKKHLARVRASKAYRDPECSLILPYDESHTRAVQTLVRQKVKKTLKYIFVIGIGGSNLGAKAVYDALRGYRDICEPQKFSKMIFLDTVDPEALVAYRGLFASLRSHDEILINIISKSGGTTETILNTEYIYAWLKKKFPSIKERIVVTTDKDSLLWKGAAQKQIACLQIPALVGGRYSVMSAVGLFPLAAAGFDISALLAGARMAGGEAFVSASILYLHAQQGRAINDNFFFHPELESVGKWYRQLLGESIGKESRSGTRVGITPTVSLGSVDLHSVGQLYLGGPRDKITTFMYTKENVGIPRFTRNDNSIPRSRMFPSIIPELAGVSAQKTMHAIFGGVQAAYKKQTLPYMTVLLSDISERSLGRYFQWKMTETMALGTLFDVNAFDQPHVELYKKETKRILMSK